MGKSVMFRIVSNGVREVVAGVSGKVVAMANAKGVWGASSVLRTAIAGVLLSFAILVSALAVNAAWGVGCAEAKTYPAAEKAIQVAVSKGRIWVDLSQAKIPWVEASAMYKRVVYKKASYIIKTKDCQVWYIRGERYANRLKISYRNASQRKALKAKVAEVLEGVSALDSQAEKAGKIHDAINKRARYDYATYNSGKLRKDSQNAYGNLVRGRNVCAGYAEAFQLVALKAGLESRYLSNGQHAWNLVRVDGAWYHIDLTWDDTGGVPRKYFLKGSEAMAQVDYHSMGDCYPTKVSVAKGDCVEPKPPVKDDASDKGKDSEGGESGTAAAVGGGKNNDGGGEGVADEGRTVDGGDSDGQGGLVVGKVKDPSKGYPVKPNDDPDEYTGGLATGMSTKDSASGSTANDITSLPAGSSWAGPID